MLLKILNIHDLYLVYCSNLANYVLFGKKCAMTHEATLVETSDIMQNISNPRV